MLGLRFLQYNNGEFGFLNCIWIVDGLGLSFGSFFFFFWLLLIHRSEHKIGIFEFELSDSIFGSLVI